MAHKEEPRETSDVRPADAGRFAAALLLSIAAVCLITYGYMHALGGADSTVSRGAMPPEPRLEADENRPVESAALNRRWDELLGSYGWVDRKRGVVRIPIERAMAIYAERRGGARR